MAVRDTIASLEAEFRRFKSLGDGALAQVPDEGLTLPLGAGGNSVAVLVWHLSGNFASRFTDFLTSDGEKPWRRRDEEFDQRTVSRAEMMAKWDSGWAVLFDALSGLTDTNLRDTVHIRGVAFTVCEALHRSLGHTAYHVGQIVLIAKTMRGDAWRTLTIPRGQSDAYNLNPALDRPEAHTKRLNKGTEQ